MAVAVSDRLGVGLLTVTPWQHTCANGRAIATALAGRPGYRRRFLICNLPGFFTASAEVQAAAAGLLVPAGVYVTLCSHARNSGRCGDSAATRHSISSRAGLLRCACLAGLRGLFPSFRTPRLERRARGGLDHLGAIGLLHLAAALASAWFLRRRVLFVFSASFLALGFACLLLPDPHRVALASIFYPIGVSLYSGGIGRLSVSACFGCFCNRSVAAGRMALRHRGLVRLRHGNRDGQNLGYVPSLFVLWQGQ